MRLSVPWVSLSLMLLLRMCLLVQAPLLGVIPGIDRLEREGGGMKEEFQEQTLASSAMEEVFAHHPSHKHSYNGSSLPLLSLHLASAAPLLIGTWILPPLLGFNLVQQPVETLRLTLILVLPVVLLIYSFISVKSRTCSIMEACGRGLVSLPIGAVIAAFGAIVFGAPMELKYSLKTFYWALLMSVLTVLPTAIVFGQSWSDWQRLFAFTKPVGPIEYLACIPAHGVVIGAWLGAWPMPLDWDRPWQEWPVCVTYGMVIGYLVGLLLSLVITLFDTGQGRQKED